MAAKKTRKTNKKTSDTQSESPLCFVIMPFGGWFDDYYETIYKPAIETVGLKAHRADNLFRPSPIVNDIWESTKRAKILLADLTGFNPNVFYELGLAHALAKPVIFVAESEDYIPFDLRHLRVIIFDKNEPAWGRGLKEKIEKALKEVLNAPASSVLPTFLNVKESGDKPEISPQEKEFIQIKQELDLLRREVSRIRYILSRKDNREIIIGGPYIREQSSPAEAVFYSGQPTVIRPSFFDGMENLAMQSMEWKPGQGQQPVITVRKAEDAKESKD